MDGLVYPNRRVHTGLLEFKNVYRPARVVSYDQNSGELVLHNYMDFLNLKDYLTVSYEVLCDGTVIAKGTVENQALLDIPAHEEGTMTLPVDVPEKGKAALKISYALNSRLPGDIRIQRSLEVPSDFHPRKTACVKTYEYRILNREFELPSERLNSYFFRRELDVERMKAACPYFLGEHDFKSFCSIHTQAETTVRTIYSLEVLEEELPDLDGRRIRIRVTGNGFLCNMVRILAGTLIQVGLGAYAPEDMEPMLTACDRQAAGPTAPAQGLTLIGMKYPEYPL